MAHSEAHLLADLPGNPAFPAALAEEMHQQHQAEDSEGVVAVAVAAGAPVAATARPLHLETDLADLAAAPIQHLIRSSTTCVMVVMCSFSMSNRCHCHEIH